MKAWTNMTKEEQASRSVKCAIGSAVLAIIFVVLGVLGQVRANNLKSRCTAETTGEVISVFPSNGRRVQPYLMANYSVDGVQYHTSGRFSYGYTSADTLSRKPVDVHYDPAAPDKSYAAEGPRTGFVFIFFVVAAVFAIAIPAFIGQANRIRARM